MSERKSADQRTADLLQAAERILERNERVTVSELAREAGVASGTFYLYFPSKAHLEATLIERFIEGYVAEAEAAMSRSGGVEERFGETLAAIVTYAVSHKAVLRLQVTHSPTKETQAIIAGGVDRLIDLLGAALAEAVDRGFLHLTDPQTTAALLFHGVEGLLRYATASDRPIDPDQLIAVAREHVARQLPAAQAA